MARTVSSQNLLKDDLLQVLGKLAEQNGSTFDCTVKVLSEEVGALPGRDTPSASQVNYWIQQLVQSGSISKVANGPHRASTYTVPTVPAATTETEKTHSENGTLSGDAVDAVLQGIETARAEKDALVARLKEQRSRIDSDLERLEQAS